MPEYILRGSDPKNFINYFLATAFNDGSSNPAVRNYIDGFMDRVIRLSALPRLEVARMFAGGNSTRRIPAAVFEGIRAELNDIYDSGGFGEGISVEELLNQGLFEEA